MSLFPSGVAVLSVQVDGERLGLTVGSVVSLSSDPPLVGVSVARQAAMHELLRGADSFGLSLLAGDQDALAQHFARGVPPIAMWEGIELRAAATDAPLLADALGWLACELESTVEAGDHTFFIGRVRCAEKGRASVGALVYRSQRYERV